MTMIPPTLPPGVHPHDRTGTDQPVVPHDRAVQPPVGSRSEPWDVKNEEAAPVFQRLAETWSTSLMVLSASNSPNRAVRAQKGRTRARLRVPAQVPNAAGTAMTNPTPAGVMYATNEGGVSQPGSGSPLNVGESVDIFSEGDIWVALQPGATSGYVIVEHFWSPPGGGLDI